MQPDQFETWQRTVQDLLEAHQRSEGRLTRLEAAVQRLVESQQRTEESLTALAESQQRMQEALVVLAQQYRRMDDRLGSVLGYVLESRYREKAVAYFGGLLRSLRVVELHTMADDLETKLGPSELREVLHLDVLLRGQTRPPDEAQEVWLAVEVSSVVDLNDVNRAERRAELLRKAGYRAVPVAGGEDATVGAQELARDRKVVLILDEKVLFWEEALQAWTS
jgi:vacuolar-type H+-ATPase subunit I/STV1